MQHRMEQVNSSADTQRYRDRDMIEKLRKLGKGNLGRCLCWELGTAGIQGREAGLMRRDKGLETGAGTRADGIARETGDCFRQGEKLSALQK